jgi:hypothetical protein
MRRCSLIGRLPGVVITRKREGRRTVQVDGDNINNHLMLLIFMLCCSLSRDELPTHAFTDNSYDTYPLPAATRIPNDELGCLTIRGT